MAAMRTAIDPHSLFRAKLVAPDNFADEKFFSTREAAIEWLTGKGLENFEGDVERAELYAPPDNKLIWSKSHPKTEDRDESAFRSAAKAGVPWRGRNAFSKKIENHAHALALYFFWYNWVRSHKAHKLTPAMAAGLTASPMEMADLVEMIDARELAQLHSNRRAMLEAAE
jgi:hypothetical protein